MEAMKQYMPPASAVAGAAAGMLTPNTTGAAVVGGLLAAAVVAGSERGHADRAGLVVRATIGLGTIGAAWACAPETYRTRAAVGATVAWLPTAAGVKTHAPAVAGLIAGTAWLVAVGSRGWWRYHQAIRGQVSPASWPDQKIEDPPMPIDVYARLVHTIRRETSRREAQNPNQTQLF